MEKLKFAYFGGEPMGAPILTELLKAGYRPSLVVVSPDKKVGRAQQLTPSPVKICAEEHSLPIFQPTSYADHTQLTPLTSERWDLFIVVAYNHILPEWLITLPRLKALNVHPSLLPALRGASPIRTALLENKREAVGVSVIELDSKMDHGPIVAQKAVTIEDNLWPMRGPELDALLTQRGGELLVATLPQYIGGTLVPEAQDHDRATYTKRFTTAESELTLDPYNLPTGEAAAQALRKTYALMGYTDTFFIHNGKRIKIHDAAIDSSGAYTPTLVTPEGKTEQSFTEWLRREKRA